jgi:hypothetical protein
MKLYVNNVQQTLSTANYPPQNQTMLDTGTRYIGSEVSRYYFDGYLTNINFIDGQQLTANSFGAFNQYGNWIPITYGGSYGSNGFFLPFTNTANATTLSYDFSPQGNNWTPSGISTTAGATYDSMTDVPTLSNATSANYCVWNPLQKLYGTPTFSNGNLQTTAVNCVSSVTMNMPTTGKIYAEFTATVSASITIGVCNQNPSRSLIIEYQSSGTKSINNVSTAYGSSYTTGDVIGVAVDCDNNQITFYKNNTSQGAILFSASGITSADMVFQAYTQSGSDAWAANFGQQPFVYTPPTGFVRLNAFNL